MGVPGDNGSAQRGVLHQELRLAGRRTAALDDRTVPEVTDVVVHTEDSPLRLDRQGITVSRTRRAVSQERPSAAGNHGCPGRTVLRGARGLRCRTSAVGGEPPSPCGASGGHLHESVIPNRRIGAGGCATSCGCDPDPYGGRVSPGATRRRRVRRPGRAGPGHCCTAQWARPPTSQAGALRMASLTGSNCQRCQRRSPSIERTNNDQGSAIQRIYGEFQRAGCI